MVVLQKTPESPLDSKEINLKGDQPWIFTGRTDAEAETPVFWSSDATADSLEKSLMLGKIEGRRRRGRQRMRWLDDISDAMNMNLGKLWEMVSNREAWHAAVHGITESLTWLGDNNNLYFLSFLSSRISIFYPFSRHCSHEIKRRLLLGRKVMTNLDSIFKSRDILFANKGPSSQGYVFSSGHVWMWELDCEESWAPKNWCF